MDRWQSNNWEEKDDHDDKSFLQLEGELREKMFPKSKFIEKIIMLGNANEEGEGTIGEESGGEDNYEVQVFDDKSAQDEENIE